MGNENKQSGVALPKDQSSTETKILHPANITSMKQKSKLKSLTIPTAPKSAKPSEFSFAIAKIAVSQICQSVGFKATQPSALETLTQVATRYLQAIAKSSASSSAASSRSQSNIFDITNALHDLHLLQGFSGCSNIHKTNYCPLGSSVLVELANFVNITVETPFFKPIPSPENATQKSMINRKSSSMSLPPAPHVPNWLPKFPDLSKCNMCLTGERRKNGEELWEKSLIEGGVDGGFTSGNGNVGEVKDLELGPKRGKVRFRFGVAGEEERSVSLGVDLNFRGGVCKGAKRICWDSDCGGYNHRYAVMGAKDDDDKR